MAFKVADLFASLRLKPDKGTFDAADKLLGKVKTALGVVIGIAGAVKFAGMIKGVTDLGDHVDELSQKTGISASDLTALGYAAGFSGVSLDSLGNSLGKFSKGADAASRGAKSQARAFKAVGVDAKALIDGHITMREALGQVAERFSKMPAGAKKSALAMELFGRSGRDLIPFLNEGKAGLAELTKEAEDLGVVIDDKTAKEYAKFNDQQDKLNAGFRGMKFLIAKELVPTLIEMQKGFIAWFKTNKAIIGLRIRQFVKGLAVVMKLLATAIGAVVRAFVFLVENWKLTLIAAGSLIAAMLLLGKTSIMAALASAAAWVRAALPIIVLAALITALALVVQDLYSWFKGGDSVLKDWLIVGVRAAVAAVKQEFIAFLEWINGKGSAKVGDVQTTVGKGRKVIEGQVYAGSTSQQERRRRGLAAGGAVDPANYRVEAGKWNAGDVFNPDLASDKQSYLIGPTAERAKGIGQLNATINLKVDQTLTPEEAAERVRAAFVEQWGVEVRKTNDAAGRR